MKNNETGEFELVLGNRQLLSGFFIVVILFAVFFLSLFIMLTFSNAIIAYGSLFRSEETAFLFARPFFPWQVFAYKVSETLLFSSWAFLFLALPLIVAYGVSGRSPWYFYPGAAAFFAVFAVIPAAAGGGAAAHRAVPAALDAESAGASRADRRRAGGARVGGGVPSVP